MQHERRTPYREFTIRKVRFIRILTATLGTGLHVSKNITDIIWEHYGLSTQEEIGQQSLWEGLRLARMINAKIATFKTHG